MEQALMVAGVGCRKDASAAEIVAAVDAALAEHGLGRDALSALAVLPNRATAQAPARAAAMLGVRLTTPQTEALELARPALLTHSEASIRATGFGSASEAAALAAAGPDARLLGPRTVNGPATCALAIGEAQ
jgi:cobalt-precorrin 5A hydrolase